ncbi:MAG: transglycosylase domain-containing protein [Faecalimonas sp.]|nr:transglycosylase domain-containing protein [Faecalimonas sp.]
MNYGRKNASKQRSQITSKKAKKSKKKRVTIFKMVLLICLLVGGMGLLAGGLVFKRIIDSAPKITAEDIKPSAYTTTVYANDGTTQLATFVDAGSNRVHVTIDQIPEDLQNAFIAVEDARFRDHKGIDIKGITRAGVTGLLSGSFSSGASTITQQLIKNTIFPNFIKETRWQSVQRKIQEMYLAVQIEKEVGDKDIILENYLNMINLGQNTLGVQAASKRYFGKDVSELNLAECATIAGITQSPEYLNPITNPEANAKRRKKVLKDMLEQEYITQEEHDEALADDVYARIQVSNTEYKDNLTVNSYFVDEVAKQVARDLVNKLGYTEAQAHNAVYSGGLKIVSTQDVRMQQICEEELNNDDNYPNYIKWGVSCAISIIHEDETQNHYDQNGLNGYVTSKYPDEYGEYGTTFDTKAEAEAMVEEYIETLKTAETDTVMKRVTISPQPQATIVVMDQYTGYVKAIVGGRGEKTSNMTLNRATQSTRQPGSCFKVLSTFIPALDAHGDTLATVIKDSSSYRYANGKKVNNWWGDYSRGSLTIRDCITQSANVCSVKKLTEITPELGFKYLTENFKFTTLTRENDMYQPLALGGISRGVYNLEITAAYAAIANKGVYTEPVVYTHLYDHNGNLLYENTPETHTAMKDTTAVLITDAMIDVIESSKGTGGAARMSNMQAAGKTGTSQESKDLWLCAYTPYLTASVWTGFDDSQSMQKYTKDESYHNRLWKKVMTRIHEGYESKKFEMPEIVEKKTICKASGNLASGDACAKYTEYFAPDTAPKKACAGHAAAPEAPAAPAAPETPAAPATP